MKKVLLFLSVIGVSLLMTSCLKGGNSSFSGQFISYVTLDETSQKVYAKALDGQGYYRFVTSPQMQSAHRPGYFAILGISWKEEYGMADGMGGSVYNVQLAGDIDKIPYADFSFSDISLSVDEKLHHFDLFRPLSDPRNVKNNFFDDNWLITYRCGLKKGETASLSFNVNPQKQNSSKKDEVIIDVTLKKSGEATGTGDEYHQEHVALHFEQLRQYLLAKIDVNYSDVVTVKFRYKKDKDATELYVSEGIDWVLREK